MVSSSNVRVSVEREEAVVFPLIFMGKGERDIGETCADAGFGGWANRIGLAGDVAVGVVDDEDEPDAETAVVCGSLGPLRKGLNSHEGVSFDVKDVRDELLASRRRSPFIEAAVDAERFDFVERIEDCDGELLKELKVAAGVLFRILVGRESGGKPSGGNSKLMRLGLSSIGAILADIIELR